MSVPLLEAKHLAKTYFTRQGLFRRQPLQALVDVSFQLQSSTVLGVVGESGCGKSTLARILVGLEEPSSGEVLFQGKSLGEISPRDYWQKVQLVFQNPYSTLNPRWTIEQALAEPLVLQKRWSRQERREKVYAMLSQVGLPPEEFARRYPHELSGGERQRVGIARALVVEPEVLICDEPVSALDVSVQASILNLLLQIQKKRPHLAYVFISHDLGVVRHMADQILVMYLGHALEFGKAEKVFHTPHHPYTQLLLSSVPEVGRELSVEGREREEIEEGETKKGCPFRSRCPKAQEKCASLEVKLEPVGEEHWSGCPFG